MNIRTLLTLFAISLCVSTASAQITIASSKFITVDAAQVGSGYSSTKAGSDGGGADNFWADAPITVTPTGFTAAGSSKLVLGLTLYNSAARVAPLTSLTYGGVDLLPNLAVGTTTTGSSFARQFIFYLDNPAVDGNLVIGLDYTTYHVDEFDVVLFALNGTTAGAPYATEQSNTQSPVQVNAAAGDFVFGLHTRNNVTSTVSNAPPYTAIPLRSGNMGTVGAYRIVSPAGLTAPAFVSGSSSTTTLAFFATSATQATVPDVVGLAQAAAESAITGASLAVGTVTNQYSPSVPAGDVISQNPTAGTIVIAGSSVSLVVSLGPPPPVNVPDVVGLDQATAQSTITGASLTVGTVTQQNDPVVPAGNVISQNPTAGSSVPFGSSVNLVVSLGPQPTVPDVMDLTQAAAQSAITGASLTVGMVTNAYSPTVPVGNVVTQSPAAGVSVNTGSSVNLAISIGPNPAPGTIAGIFTYKNDFGSLDAQQSDNYGATPPITISPFAFTAAGTGKLVAVISLHNSAVNVAAVTGVTYGGVSLNAVTGNLAGTAFTKNGVYYLDNVTTDGNLVINFNATPYHIDEVGVQLFALNGLPSGTAYTAESTGSGILTPINAGVGDFVVGVAQVNNNPGSITVSNSPPYSAIDLTKGNLTSILGYQVASIPGATAPNFAHGTFVPYESVAAFGTGGLSSGFDDWKMRNGATDVTFTGDKNGDGVADGLAFFLGADNPNVDAKALLPTASKPGGDLVMTFSCLAGSARGTSVLNLEWDGDLAPAWSSVAVPDTAGTTNPTDGTGAVNIVASDGGTNGAGDALLDIVATISDAAESSAGKLFGRLRAEQP